MIDQLGVAESDILEYVDDGVSGTHFKRQGFQQLQDDMKSGEIGCVVVKDFSDLEETIWKLDFILNIFSHFYRYDLFRLMTAMTVLQAAE